MFILISPLFWKPKLTFIWGFSEKYRVIQSASYHRPLLAFSIWFCLELPCSSDIQPWASDLPISLVGSFISLIVSQRGRNVMYQSKMVVLHLPCLSRDTTGCTRVQPSPFSLYRRRQSSKRLTWWKAMTFAVANFASSYMGIFGRQRQGRGRIKRKR